MKNMLPKYLAILKVELEDLKSDIDFQIELTRTRKDEGNITNYVFMENQALYKNMNHAINTFNLILKETDPAAFTCLDDLIDHLKNRFSQAVEEYGYAQAAIRYTDRKLNKVSQYINAVEECL